MASLLSKNALQIVYLATQLLIKLGQKNYSGASLGKNQKYRHSDRQRKDTEPPVKCEEPQQAWIMVTSHPIHPKYPRERPPGKAYMIKPLSVSSDMYRRGQSGPCRWCMESTAMITLDWDVFKAILFRLFIEIILKKTLTLENIEV